MHVIGRNFLKYFVVRLKSTYVQIEFLSWSLLSRVVFVLYYLVYIATCHSCSLNLWGHPINATGDCFYQKFTVAGQISRNYAAVLNK